MAALKLDANFGDVLTLAIIRDADDDPIGAFQSVCDSLQHHALPVPKGHGEFTNGQLRVGVFIMPDGKADGMLESLCMQAVEDKPETPCLKAYIDCLAEKGLDPKPLEKARAHAWLASQPKPGKRVGEAAQAGYWPFDHSVFTNIWQFISAM